MSERYWLMSGILLLLIFLSSLSVLVFSVVWEFEDLNYALISQVYEVNRSASSAERPAGGN
jgi:hypothetical protein